jgi:hypothetical protein
MSSPDTDHIRIAFKERYLFDHGSLDGWEDAFNWWLNPDLECANQKAVRPGPRCKTPCEFCIGNYNRRIARENQ